jgi:hypothetical protein
MFLPVCAPLVRAQDPFEIHVYEYEPLTRGEYSLEAMDQIRRLPVGRSFRRAAQCAEKGPQCDHDNSFERDALDVA